MHQQKFILKLVALQLRLGRGDDYVYYGTTEFRGTHEHDVLQLGENEQKAYGFDKTTSDIFSEYYLIKVNQFNEQIKNTFYEWIYFLKTEKIQAKDY